MGARRWLAIPWLAATMLLMPVAASAGPDGLERPWHLQGGGYVHYDDSNDYEGPPLALGIEYHRPGDWLAGFTLFNNSFGQFSQYGYVGKQFHPLGRLPGLRLKLTAGIIQGYRDEHFDALPVRWEERWGLGVVPSIGYQHGRIGVDVAFLKESAVLFLLGYRF